MASEAGESTDASTSVCIAEDASDAAGPRGVRTPTPDPRHPKPEDPSLEARDPSRGDRAKSPVSPRGAVHSGALAPSALPVARGAKMRRGRPRMRLPSPPPPTPAELEARWGSRACDSGSDGESLVDDRCVPPRLPPP